MTLQEKLRRIKKIEDEYSPSDWDIYKENWINSIKDLQNTITYKWFGDYENEKLMEFLLIPHKRDEAYIGQYFISSLEITVANNKTFLLEPISAVTTQYDSKLEFSMLGNYNKRINILREIVGEKSKWIIINNDNDTPLELTKVELENLINKWLA